MHCKPILRRGAISLSGNARETARGRLRPSPKSNLRAPQRVRRHTAPCKKVEPLSTTSHQRSAIKGLRAPSSERFILFEKGSRVMEIPYDGFRVVASAAYGHTGGGLPSSKGAPGEGCEPLGTRRARYGNTAERRVCTNTNSGASSVRPNFGENIF